MRSSLGGVACWYIIKTSEAAKNSRNSRNALLKTALLVKKKTALWCRGRKCRYLPAFGGEFGKRVAHFVVSFQEWKQKHSQHPLRAFHEKRNVNSKLVSCFVSTFECHAKQPQEVGVSFLHDFPVSTLALSTGGVIVSYS